MQALLKALFFAKVATKDFLRAVDLQKCTLILYHMADHIHEGSCCLYLTYITLCLQLRLGHALKKNLKSEFLKSR